jgi:hypothetical protein
MRTRACVVVALAAITAIALAAAASSATAESRALAAALNLRADLYLVSTLGACQPPSYADDCAVRKSTGGFPGLGQVTATYEFYIDRVAPSCGDPDTGLALASPALLTVQGKGEIHLAIEKGAQCLPIQEVLNQTQAFTITGGTGIYAGASGSGSLARRLGAENSAGRVGREIWTGTLNVPGLEFDTTPPTLSGASSRTVKAAKRAKSARVTFAVSARDDKDDTVPVTCFPKSGFRFPVGKTKVTCSATDSSANRSSSSFTITVKKAR